VTTLINKYVAVGTISTLCFVYHYFVIKLVMSIVVMVVFIDSPWFCYKVGNVDCRCYGCVHR
jgi:hypothetical protein